MAAILSVIRGGQGSRQSPFHNQPPHSPNHSLTRSISSFPLQSQHPEGEKGFQLLRYPLPQDILFLSPASKSHRSPVTLLAGFLFHGSQQCTGLNTTTTSQSRSTLSFLSRFDQF